MKIDKVEVGKRIMRLRKEKGYTQEKLSEMMEISKNHLSGIECGKYNVTLETLSKLCNTLGRTPDYYLIGQVSPTVDSLTTLIRQLSPLEQQIIEEMVKVYIEKRNK